MSKVTKFYKIIQFLVQMNISIVKVNQKIAQMYVLFQG